MDKSRCDEHKSECVVEATGIIQLPQITLLIRTCAAMLREHSDIVEADDGELEQEDS